MKTAITIDFLLFLARFKNYNAMDSAGIPVI